MTTLYSHNIAPTDALDLSEERDAIIHVQCPDAPARRRYADALSALLDDSDEFGGGDDELEIVGSVGGSAVRVHLSLA